MASNNKFKILAFDPGLTSTGWSLIEGDIESRDVVVLKVGELHPGQLADRAMFRDEVGRFDKRVVTLRLLREGVTKLLDDIKPDLVCAEDIFINPRRPQAYGALCMWTAVVRMHCRDVVGKYLVSIPTKICKQVVTGRGDMGKLTVQQAIAAHPHIKFKDLNDLAHMTEHEADSIAVGMALFDRYHDLIVKEVKERNERRTTPS